jgi:o-succinylbenzoate synthase
MPLVTPFRTSQSVQHARRSLLVRVVADNSEGWADLSVDQLPVFGHEFIAGTWVSLAELLVPSALAGAMSAAHVTERIASIVGHPAAKAALETAVLDAELREAGMSLSRYLGGTQETVPVGVSVGITETVRELLDLVSGYLEEGYLRIKLKIQPGWDEGPVAAVRKEFGEGLDLQVDGNGAYRSSELRTLTGLDSFHLTMIEQPFPATDLRSHVRLAAQSSTPVCMDESITSASAAVMAIELGACSIVNIKPSRVGGYLEARRIHDVCQAMSVPVWCGGMLESGVGRAANLALASLPNFTYPGDISATSRYFAEDLCEPFELSAGRLRVPAGPGIGVDVDLEAVERFTTRREVFTPADRSAQSLRS